MSLLKPHHRFHAVTDIQTGFLKKENINALLVDIDNTIVPWRGEIPTPSVVEWFTCLSKAGVKVALLSNAGGRRAERMAERLRVPVVAPAKKPFKPGYRRALALIGARRETAAIVGDQVFMDVIGGNRSGLITILVEPVSRKEFTATRVLRYAEKLVRKPL